MKRFYPLAVVLLGCIFLVFGVGYFLFNWVITHPAAAPLPEQVSNLPLTRQTTGSQAVQEINRLHRKGFPLTSGAVGNYGTQNQATLWVSGTLFKPAATQILTAMKDRIAEGNSPFTTTGEYQDKELTIYTLVGMGQKHFYFQSNNLVIWLAADADLADQAITQVLEFYR